MPKISVIIPIYNSEKHLRQCLDSVINQTFKDIEIICVNDGSTDRSEDILSEYSKKDDRIIVINQKNSKAGIARNNGVNVAKGDYIHFLDSDDWIKADTYQNLYELMLKNDNIDFILFGRYEIDIKTNKSIERIPRIEKDNLISNIQENHKLFCTNIFIAPWCKFYKKKFIVDNNLEFDSNITAEDRIFYISSILAATQILVTKQCFIYHRVNNKESLVGEVRLKNYDCHFKSYELVKKKCEDQPINIKRIIINMTIMDLFSFYHKSYGKYKKEIYLKLHEYFQTLDVSVCESNKSEYSWWNEYMAIKTGNIKKADKEFKAAKNKKRIIEKIYNKIAKYIYKHAIIYKICKMFLKLFRIK